MVKELYINEDNLVRWNTAKLGSDDTYINSGSGTWTLRDNDLVELATGSLVYVTSTNGRWQAIIPSTDTEDLVENATYWLDLELTNNNGADGFRRIECVAVYHGVI